MNVLPACKATMSPTLQHPIILHSSHAASSEIFEAINLSSEDGGHRSQCVVVAPYF